MGNYQQCDFAQESRSYYPKSSTSNCNCLGNDGPCDAQFLTFPEVPPAMNAMGFMDSGLGAIDWQIPTPPAAPEAGPIITSLCDGGNYVVAGHYWLNAPDAHAIVIYDWDIDTGIFFINNPKQPEFLNLGWAYWAQLVQGRGSEFGPMVRYLSVRLFLPTFVGFDDISRPGVDWDWTYPGKIRQVYTIYWTASAGDSTCLYVSDNPWGPVRRVYAHKPLVQPLPYGEYTTRYFDDQPYNEHAFCYHFLDHGGGGFAALRSPVGLKSSYDNPVESWGTVDADRDSLAAPDLISVVDAQIGNKPGLQVSWALSTDDAALDYYNVYRREDREYDPGWLWLGSVPRGSSSFIDTTCSLPQPYTYRVSSAHHGSNASTSYGRLGIYNDFSDPLTGMRFGNVEGTRIRAFARSPGGATVDMPQSFATLCPAGDRDTLVVELALDATRTAFSVQSIAPENLSLSIPGATGAVADSSLGYARSVDGFVAGAYRTTFSVASMSQCAIDSVTVSLTGNLVGSTAINVKSYDANPAGLSFGIVNLADFAEFANRYTSSNCDCVLPKIYSTCVDYAPPDTVVNLPDVAEFWAHYNHAIPGGGSASRSIAGASLGSVLLEIEETHPLIGEHTLRTKVSLQGVEPFKVAVLALRNDSPKLEFVSWAGSSDSGAETMCAETVRDGHKDVFIGVLANGSTTLGNALVGTAEFRVRSDQELTLGEDDLALVTADLLSTTSERAFTVNSLKAHRAVASLVYKNELAQNYPNPFNPSTTIAFSIARDTDVELTIYDVRGALVRTLLDRHSQRGIHRVQWDGRNESGEAVASGVYFYRLNAGSFTSTKKMVMLK